MYGPLEKVNLLYYYMGRAVKRRKCMIDLAIHANLKKLPSYYLLKKKLKCLKVD